MITAQLPAGLTDRSAEFYSNENMLMALTEGSSLPVVQSERLKQPILNHMISRPVAHKKIVEWVGSDVDAQINRYGQCLWGAFNTAADLDADGNLSDPEFIQCTQKGKCEYEKHICKCVFSPAEDRVLPHILWADRIIGQILNVSPLTITTQIKSIKQKINVQTKAELVDWANNNGIKLCK